MEAVAPGGKVISFRPDDLLEETATGVACAAPAAVPKIGEKPLLHRRAHSGHHHAGLRGGFDRVVVVRGVAEKTGPRPRDPQARMPAQYPRRGFAGDSIGTADQENAAVA